jgi:hypothetical protein
MSIDLLKATIDTYKPARMSDGDASDLELLLSLEAFEPVWDLVESKLEAFYEHLRCHPQYEFNGESATEKPRSPPPLRKKESKEGAVGNPLVMTFRTVNGLLVPVDLTSGK